MEKSNIKQLKSQKLIFNFLRQKAYINLFKKYSSNKFSFNSILINYIIYNRPCLIVAKFKDYLVYDDDGEFLNNYFYKDESFFKLNNLLNLYTSYSKVFPNYLVIKEKKYMYRNIRKKQKMIDAYNKILMEEEENRKKIKTEEIILDFNNKIFTKDVKDEIKLFEKNTTLRKYKNSFNTESYNENTKSFPWSSSISISVLNNKYLNNINENNAIKDKSIDSLITNESNGTLTNLVKVMNESKIYVNDLCETVGINNYSKYSNILVNNKIYKDKDKDKGEDKEKMNDNKNTIKEKYISLKNNKIVRNKKNQNENKFKIKKIIKKIKTPKKKMIETITEKNNFTSILSKKVGNEIKSNYNNKKNKKKNSDSHNIILSSLGETIININNNYFHTPIQTVRYEEPKLEINKVRINSNSNSNFKSNTYNQRKEEKNCLTLNNNNKLFQNQKTINTNTFRRIKSKHISHDFTFKKTINLKYLNNNTIKKNREYSPPYILESTKKELAKEIIKELKKNYISTDRQNTNKQFVKLNLKSLNNFAKIKLNLIKNKEFIKNSILKKIDKSNETTKHKNEIKLKSNFKKIDSKSKFNKSEYLLSYLNRTKTETNISKPNNKDRVNTKLFFKHIKQNINKSKNQSFPEKLLTSISRRKEKVKKKFSKQIRTLISKQTKGNLKINHRKISSNICPNIKISNYNNNIINYSTINTNNNILLTSSRKNDKSNIYENNGHFKNNRLSIKKHSYKKNSIFNSPVNSLQMIKNENNKLKNNNKLLLNLNKKSYLNNQKTEPNNYTKIDNNSLKNEYKKYFHKKYNKKSCDLNQEIKKKCEKNILKKINNSNNLFSSIFENNSNSIDMNNNKSKNIHFHFNNTLKHSNKIRLMQLSVREGKNKKDKYDKFNKLMIVKMQNLKKRNDNRIIKNNTIKNEKNLPLSIKVNS